MKNKRNHKGKKGNAKRGPAGLKADQQQQAQPKFYCNGDGNGNFRQRHAFGCGIANGASKAANFAEASGYEQQRQQYATNQRQGILQGCKHGESLCKK